MDNQLTIAELKRRGMAAIEDALVHGPVHILKHNRSSAVVLSPEQFQELSSRTRNAILPGRSVAQWLASQKPKGGLTKAQIDRRLKQERDW